MAIKNRALIKLGTTKNHILRAKGTGGKKALVEVYRELTEIRNLYIEGLPQHDYIKYGEFCDGLILAVRNMIKNSGNNFWGEELSMCLELIQYLKNETEKETGFKKEIFFLPYKSSMWDSLESVWKAAYDDKEHCNAYVMPIPYCDRNPDTSAAEWHCERDQFPNYVPTLDWKYIDLEALHPDIIVYHNPYDAQNRVTSVDSRYYSENLKLCADKLVYIPYFVLNEPCTEKNVSHFILLPGVINANMVFVQSEPMRQIYIDVLSKATNVSDREFWEKRIFGVGSPKIDKVLNSKREDFEMPEKWRKLVEDKKVILYNTSISATLENADKVCDKLRYVFNVFRNRDDVVLWWRPHPLMKATFHSMLTQFEKEYLSLVKQYIEEGWGIYDDSPDLYRAIHRTDAYFGDCSSLLSLYRLTGKPIMQENFYSFGIYRNTLPVVGRCAVRDSDDLWIFSVYTNCLMRFSLKTECLCEYHPLPENPWDYAVFSFAKSDRYLYLAPCNARECWRFDMDSRTFEIVDIGLTDSEKDIPYKFVCSVIHDGKLYLFGGNLPEIIVFDLSTQKYERIYGWLDELATFGVKTDGKLINQFYALGKHEIYLPIEGEPYILIIRTDLNGYDLRRISIDEHEYYHAIYYRSETLYLTNNKDETIVWNLQQDSVRRVKNNFLSGQIVDYGYIYVEEDRIVYIPLTFSFIGYKKSGEEVFRKIKLPMNLLDIYPDGLYLKYGFAIWVNNVLYLQSNLDGTIYAIDLERESVKVCGFSIHEKLFSDFLERKNILKWGNDQRFIRETDDMFLHKFIGADIQYTTDSSPKQTCFSGEEIYHYCIS